jgi:hypothetical protein
MTTINTLSVFNAARIQGKSTQAVVDAIVALHVNVDNKDGVNAIANAYKAGRLCASLGLKSEKEANQVFARAPYANNRGVPFPADGKARRDAIQDKACRNAISAWSTMRLLAGLESARNGAQRAVRTPSAGKPAQLPANMVTIAKAKSPADVHTFALKIAGVLNRYLGMNAKVEMGDDGTAMRAFVAAVNKPALAKAA